MLGNTRVLQTTGVPQSGGTFTGPILFPDGTITAPSIAFSSDADGSGTGFYRSAANTIGVTCNGVYAGDITAQTWSIGSGGAGTPKVTIGYMGVGSGGKITGPNELYLGGNSGTCLLLWSGNSSVPLAICNGTTVYARFGANQTDGHFLVTDNAGTSFGRMMFGGTTSSYPALKRSTTILEARLADDSAYTSVTGKFFKANDSVLTDGLTAVNSAEVRTVVSRYDWTNANVVALGAALTGDITVCTLPAKTVITNAFIVITGAAAGPTTVTVSLGTEGSPYVSDVVASDAKAAANTVYGNIAAERGTGAGWDYPSHNATTAVKMHWISTVQNLDQVTGSTGIVYLETMTLP
jgi:hypothetical protein